MLHCDILITDEGVRYEHYDKQFKDIRLESYFSDEDALSSKAVCPFLLMNEEMMRIMNNDVETMFYEYVVPCIVMSCLLLFLIVMVGKGLERPTHHELSLEERRAIVQSWDN